MTEVLDVLRVWQTGKGYRATAKLVTVDRKTVRRYIEAAEGLGVARDGGAGQLTDELLGQVAQAVRPGRPCKPGEMRALCRVQRPRIQAWLDDGVLVPKVRTLLHRMTGVLVPERTLMRFVAEEIGRTRKRKSTVRIARRTVPTAGLLVPPHPTALSLVRTGPRLSLPAHDNSGDGKAFATPTRPPRR